MYMEIRNKKVRLIMLVIMVIGLGAGLYLLLSGLGVLPSRAANVEYGLEVSSGELEEGETLVVNVNMDTNGNDVGYVKAEITFDENKIELSQEPVVSDEFGRQIEVSSKSDANQNGKMILVLGADPSQRNNLPSGNVQLATLRFEGIITSPNQTVNLTVNTQNSSAVSQDGIRLAQTAENVNVVLNPTTSPTATATTNPTPTSTPAPTTPPTVTPAPSIPPIGDTQGIWLSKEEIMALPTSGSAWNDVLSDANSSWGSANLGDNNSGHDVKTYAGALVAVRNNDSSMRSKVISGLQSAMNSGTSRTLELARGLQSYVIAADLIGYRTSEFESWVREMLEDTSIDGRVGGGLFYNAMRDSSNWGGHERASSIAAAMYLGDNAKLSDLAKAHREFIGEDVSPKLMKYKDTNWHADPNNKAGVNRKGAKIQGVDVSGVLPEDWRRSGEFKWPPDNNDSYKWEGMQGFVVSAVMLHRAGLVNASAGDSAVARATDILFRAELPPQTDDAWIVYLVNKYWGTNYPTKTSAPGKGMGYTDWTHQK